MRRECPHLLSTFIQGYCLQCNLSPSFGCTISLRHRQHCINNIIVSLYSTFSLKQGLPSPQIHHYSTFRMASSRSPTNTTNNHLPPSGNIAEVRTWKQSLQKRVRRMLKAMPEEDIKRQSLEVWQRLFAFPAYTQAKSMALFLSMPSGEIELFKTFLFKTFFF